MRLSPSLSLPFALLAALPLAAETRSVTDDAGRAVNFSAAPERVVVLHEPLLGVPLLDLGLPLAGAYGRAADGTSLAGFDFITTVLGERTPHPLPPGIGPTGAIDLEYLRELNPGLIIATEYNLDLLERLSSVAPVYVQNVGTGRVHGIDVQRDLAGLLGLEAEMAARLTDYFTALDATRQKLPPTSDTPTFLAVMLTEQIGVVGSTSGLVQALEDLGFAPLPIGPTGAFSGPGSNFIAPVSAEAFLRLDPDLLVVMTSYGLPVRDEATARATLDRLAPGWDRFMRPAREGRVVFVDSALVSTPSVASGEHMLRALRDWVQASK